MSDRNSEDIIGALYDMVQDARSMPLAADKCILERDKVLDMLDEIIAQLPAELKQSRTIVESRNELISQARREAENIVRQAQEQSKQMVTKEAIYAEAKKRSEELVGQTQAKIEQLRKAGNAYMDDSLRQTEEVVSKALAEIRETRMKFRTVTEAQQQRKTPNVDVEAAGRPGLAAVFPRRLRRRHPPAFQRRLHFPSCGRSAAESGRRKH